MRHKTTHAACIAALALAFASSAQATTVILYSQSFDPNATGDLNGTAVQTGTGNWVAGSGFSANGAIANEAGQSATLAFTPVDGLIYTLDASFRNFSDVGATSNNDWLALGFANGQNSLVNNGTRFAGNNAVSAEDGGPVRGLAWMLVRGRSDATINNAAWLGTPSHGSPTGGNATWSDAALAGTYGGSIDLRVVLDTTGGAGTWTANWFAKLAADSDYTEVRSATQLLNENINSVGIARANPGFTADVTFFSLTSIPEPSAALLGGLGLLALLRRRRCFAE